jgi:hypothetical protein
MGFERAGCYVCDWNRIDGGELKAGGAAKACEHADASGHRTFVVQRRVREFRPRPAKAPR